MELLALGAIARSLALRTGVVESLESGQAPLSTAKSLVAASACSRINLKILLLMESAIAVSNGTPFFCR